MTARSYLFVPGDRSDMLAKAGARGADAVIADLEDAVAPSRKDEARATIVDWLADLNDPSFEVWVRINAGHDTLAADLEVARSPNLTGVMVPKIHGADALRDLALRLEKAEATTDRRNGPAQVLPIVETARAVLDLEHIARAPRVHQMMIGELDLGADLGIDPSATEAFMPIRMQLVVASAAAGIHPPLGPVSPDYQDLDRLRAETQQLVRTGFGSRPGIHPAQIPIINECFTPSPAKVAEARRLVEEYEAALATGRGAVRDEHGHMVDEAVVRVARRLLAAARRSGVDS